MPHSASDSIAKLHKNRLQLELQDLRVRYSELYENGIGAKIQGDGVLVQFDASGTRHAIALIFDSSYPKTAPIVREVDLHSSKMRTELIIRDWAEEWSNISICDYLQWVVHVLRSIDTQCTN